MSLSFLFKDCLDPVESKEISDLPTEEEKVKYLRNKNKWYLELIFSFNHRDQKFGHYLFNRTSNDLELLTQIFKVLRKAELTDLMKISSCMFYSDDADFPEFLANNNGKFYFNPDVNDDDDIIRYYEHKEQYLKELPKKTRKRKVIVIA